MTKKRLIDWKLSQKKSSMKRPDFIHKILLVFFSFLLKIRGFFVEKPKRQLTWSVDDYRYAKKWSKTQKHPYMDLKTLWDYCEDHADSVYTIQNVNNFIKI